MKRSQGTIGHYIQYQGQLYYSGQKWVFWRLIRWVNFFKRSLLLHPWHKFKTSKTLFNNNQPLRRFRPLYRRSTVYKRSLSVRHNITLYDTLSARLWYLMLSIKCSPGEDSFPGNSCCFTFIIYSAARASSLESLKQLVTFLIWNNTHVNYSLWVATKGLDLKLFAINALPSNRLW